MTDEVLSQWLKVLAEEQRRQTKAIEDMANLILVMVFVVVGEAILSILAGILSSGLFR